MISQFYLTLFSLLTIRLVLSQKQFIVYFNFVPNYSGSFLEFFSMLAIIILLLYNELYIYATKNIFIGLLGTWITYSTIRHIIFDFKYSGVFKNLLITIEF